MNRKQQPSNRTTGGTESQTEYEHEHERERGVFTYERVSWLKTIGFHVLLWSLVLVVLFPVFWMVIVSLNQTPFDTFIQDPMGWLNGVSLSAYQQVLFETELPTWMLNSVVISIVAVALAIVVCTFGAYSIGRLEFPGRRGIATFLLITQMFPAILIAIPMFLIFGEIGLANTRAGLVIAYVAFTLPFAVWMLRGFYENLPTSLEDAAMIDGCTRLGSVIRVIIPLSKPAIATTAIFAWVQAWNELVFALVLLNDPRLMTLPPGLARWVGRYAVNWDLLMAGAVCATIPMLIVFFFLQSYIVEGLAEGAVKT